MQKPASDKIIYEHPLNERTRTFLRLEHLFKQLGHHLPNEDEWGSRATINALLDIVNIFGRADIKAELLKELERHRQKLASMKQLKGVDTRRLDQILAQLEESSLQLHQIAGQVCQELKENEFLKSIMQRNTIPGGSCAFDLPLYHYWLQQPPATREAELRQWMSTLSDIETAVNLLLSLIRGSTHPTREQAQAGFYQQALDSQNPVQLIRVGLPRGTPLFAEISGGKHRFSIRFMEPTENERPTQTDQDISFFLNCCTL